MSRRTEVAYVAALKYINENVMPLECYMIMTDFELALRNAFKSLVPNALVRLCWFHFTQACKRVARKLEELFQLIKGDDGKAIHHRLLALPLLPADKITWHSLN